MTNLQVSQGVYNVNLTTAGGGTYNMAGTVQSAYSNFLIATSGTGIISSGATSQFYDPKAYTDKFIKLCEEGEVIFELVTEEDEAIKMNVIVRDGHSIVKQNYKFDDSEEWVEIPVDYESLLQVALGCPNELLVQYLKDVKQYPYDENIQVVYRLNGQEDTIKLCDLMVMAGV